MSGGRNKIWLVASGVMCAVLIGEVAMRLLEPLVPPPSRWPTVETQVKSTQLAALRQDVDLVLLGSSVTEAAVDPSLLSDLAGTNGAYNAALPFSSPLSDQVWIEEVVLESVSPSLVIIGLPAWPASTTFGSDPLRAGVERATSPVRFPRVTQSLALLRNKGVLSNWDERQVRETMSSSDLWTEFGHQTGYYQRQPESLVGLFAPYGQPRLSPDNLAALSETVHALKRAGLQTVLMIEPGKFPGEVSDSNIDIYLDSIKDVGRDLGVQVWDTYSREWNPDYYLDDSHFNREGTVAFTTYLAGLIRELVGG